MKVKVSSPSSTVVAVNTHTTSEVVAVGIQGPSGPNSISLANDVDVTGIEDGSVLVYKTNSLKWKATRTLEQQNLEGGHY